MNSTLKLLMVATVSLFLFAGCGNGGTADGTPVPETPSESVAQLKGAFEDSPEANLHERFENFGSALEEEKYESAYKTFNGFQQLSAQNVNQVIAVENAYRRLQMDVARAAEAGDPAAKRVWGHIKGRSRD